MSKIDKSNFEAYLLDYSDGNLSSDDLNELILFLALNDDLGVELSELAELPTLQADKLNSGIQYKLLKTESDIQQQFDELCFQFYNKEITESEKNQLDFLIKQFARLEKDFIAFGHAYLLESEFVEFENKERLKKQFTGAGSFEDLAVKSIEGTISQSEEVELHLLISEKSSYQKEFDAFKKTILPSENILFPNKDFLYKEGATKNIILLWTARLSVAASILLVLGFFILNQNTDSRSGLAIVNTKPLDSIRKASQREAIPIKNPKENTIIIENPQKRIPVKNQLNKTINESENKLVNLDSKPPYLVNGFELPSEYIALKPNELTVLTNELFVMKGAEEGFLNPSQIAWKQIKQVLLRNKIDIDKPINEVKKDGFAEVGYRSLEKVTRGNLIIERENSENGSKIRGVQFRGIGFSR